MSDGDKPAAGGTDFKAALEKAKAIAAKLNANKPAKRPSESDNAGAPDAKRTGVVAPIVPKGLPGPGGYPMGMGAPVVNAAPGMYGAAMAAQQFGGSAQAPQEDITIPNQHVGRIIGRGGETINKLQNESACRIQISQDTGLPERPVQLIGTREAIEKAKRLISQVVSQHEAQDQATATALSGGPQPGQETMMIPAERVGLVIGKGGETIQSLQMQTGAKLQMIQDDPHAREKPLLISGAPEAVARAKQAVNELVFERGPPGPDGGGYAPGTGVTMKLPIKVPQFAVGRVIGRGGETIKRIQAETGARVQFDQVESHQGGDREATISGNQDAIEAAEQIIVGIIKDAELPQPGKLRIDESKPREDVMVPSDKAGLVIGRGGETIRMIKETTGADVDLDRNHPAGHEKKFVVAGTPDQIANARRMILEKVEGSRRPFNPHQQLNPIPFNNGGGYGSNYGQSYGGGSYGNNDPYANSYGAYQQQQQQQQQQQSQGQQATGAVPPGYPSHEQYLQYKDWYNAQGYYGYPGIEQGTQPSASAAAAAAQQWAQQQQQQGGAASSQAPPPPQ
eukprot:TRINITY_DN12347_c1_g4_i3.p1 TRINITY_DN12347_c1_g4~~TRINITY_DN12347_c1_g4_i3.p1  ORF type:complete len:566 (+),score=157.13 TRINITY_DN12347_c1_g4_i3:155-1852(+)